MIEGEPGTPFAEEVVVTRKRWESADSGFAIVEAERDGDEIVLVGTLAHLERNERIKATGVWEDDRRYGMQVKVSAVESLAPSGNAALLAYLKRVRHVGLGRAGRLLQAYGEDVLDVVDRDPQHAFRAAGVAGGKRLEEAVRSWHALRATRALHLLLAPHGLAYLVTRIVKHYGDGAHGVVQERPYELTSVFGVGFATADKLARAGAYREDSPARIRAGVIHTLAEAERDGCTCLPVTELVPRATELLGVAPAASLLREMNDASEIVLEVDADEQVWAYRRPTAALEGELARRIRELVESDPADDLDAPDEPPPDFDPAPAQWQAVCAAFASRLSVITGGPGTGKTATVRLIVHAAEEQDATVLLVAPTGRAARRMAESTGAEAATVHSALGWIPGEGPARDESDPLDVDVLVVDETSMANLELLVTLLRAVGEDTHVVLVGDADQLAPVGAGKPFAELIEAGAAPTAELTHIFRQAAGSMIVRGAHAVRQGGAPDFTAREELQRDLFLVERADARAALDEIESMVTRRLPEHFGIDPVTEIQVFAPVYKGALGIDAINARLRAALNPDGRPILGGRLRIGDKLMLAGRNLHELGLMNGTVMRLLEYRESDEVLLVETDTGTIELPEDEANKLQLAYACSVHRGQGIELPVGIVVAHPAAGAFFLRREMLYTAMTRARRATVIVGTRAVVARAAATPDTSRRWSRLGERLLAGPPRARPRVTRVTQPPRPLP